MKKVFHWAKVGKFKIKVHTQIQKLEVKIDLCHLSLQLDFEFYKPISFPIKILKITFKMLIINYL